jgi:hypothetical protein
MIVLVELIVSTMLIVLVVLTVRDSVDWGVWVDRTGWTGWGDCKAAWRGSLVLIGVSVVDCGPWAVWYGLCVGGWWHVRWVERYVRYAVLGVVLSGGLGCGGPRVERRVLRVVCRW